jgi:Ca-activated chloride channel family protein
VNRRASRLTRWVLAFCPLLCGFEPLRSRNGEIEQGNALMKGGNAEEALKHYEKAVTALPGDPGAHFDRGAALYALSRFDEAGQEFLRATEAKDGALKASAFYNLGNAFFKKEKFKEAVEAYKRTLALDPRSERAKWNLEIALRKQKDQEEKEKEKNKDKDKQDKKDDKKKDDKKQDDKKQDDKKQDKKDDKKQPPEDPDKKNDPSAKQPPPPPPSEPRDMEPVLDSLERSPRDLEKERARLRAIRRRPPARDW